MDKLYPREFLLNIAKLFKEYCDEVGSDTFESMEIVGSLRRGKEQCHDIDLLVVPKFHTTEALFGEGESVSMFDSIDLSGFATVEKNGTKLKQLTYKSGLNKVNIDVYVSIHPYSYGVLKVIRTGPESFSHRIVKPVEYGGCMPKLHHVEDGFLKNNYDVVDCSTELMFFEAIGMDYIKPKDRK